MTKDETKEVKRILHDPDREFVLSVLDKVNLSLREKTVITCTELDRITISEMADKLYLSTDSISSIKRSAVKKLYSYFMQKNYIKNTI